MKYRLETLNKQASILLEAERIETTVLEVFTAVYNEIAPDEEHLAQYVVDHMLTSYKSEQCLMDKNLHKEKKEWIH